MLVPLFHESIKLGLFFQLKNLWHLCRWPTGIFLKWRYCAWDCSLGNINRWGVSVLDSTRNFYAWVTEGGVYEIPRAGGWESPVKCLCPHQSAQCKLRNGSSTTLSPLSPHQGITFSTDGWGAREGNAGENDQRFDRVLIRGGISWKLPHPEAAWAGGHLESSE